MKPIALITFILFVGMIHAQQSENVFLTRDFWKAKPSLDLVKNKIKEGHDPVAFSKFRMDATSYAILENASSDVIQYLLSIDGNDVNKPTHDKRNYLMWASYKGNKSLVKSLLDRGSKTDIVDDHGYNLLTFTALAGVDDTEIYDMILRQGVDINSTNRTGANALLLSCSKAKDESLISYFENKGLQLKSVDKEGNNAFHFAARGGNITLMETLINRGVDYKAINANGENAINWASKGTHRKTNGIEVFQYLEKLGLATDLISKNGTTPLHGLAGSKTSDVIEYFINKGIDINAVNDKGNTFFHMAAARKNEAMFLKYMNLAKNLNLKNEDGMSALTFALRRKSSGIVDALISQKCDLNIVDKKGNTIVGHLFDSYNESNARFFYEYLDVFKNKGVQVLAKQAQGNTLAHMAVENLSPQLIQKSIALGVDINALNADGYSPLQLAAMKAKSPKILKLLLSLGANRAVQSEMGESVFDIASENELLANSNLQFLK